MQSRRFQMLPGGNRHCQERIQRGSLFSSEFHRAVLDKAYTLIIYQRCISHNHSYFDPNIWHLDEELRKQVESFAKCFILTGQEAPETSRKLHIDLYKKTISGDGIMGRKPYGYSTRMFQMIGWTRLEVNKIDVLCRGKRTTTSTQCFRRTFVWKAKARFIHEKFLTNYSDHEKDGIFRADPSLGKFLSTSQASIAGLKLQWAFEIDHSKAGLLSAHRGLLQRRGWAPD